MKDKVILFGASNYGKVSYNILKEYYDIKYYCDNDRLKWRQSINNIKIIDPKYLQQMIDYKIIITSDYYNEILSQLHKYNILECMIFRKIEKENILFVVHNKKIIEYVFLSINKRICKQNSKTYIMNFDGTEKKVLGDKNFKFIKLVNRWIYYSSMEDNDEIYRIKLDGTMNERIKKLKVLSTIIYNDRISIVFNGAIKISKIDNSNQLISIVDDKYNKINYILEVYNNVLSINFVNVKNNSNLSIYICKDFIRDIMGNSLDINYQKKIVINTNNSDLGHYKAWGIYDIFPFDFSENAEDKLQFDKNGIPLYNVQGSFRYNPAVIAGYGLYCYSKYILTHQTHYINEAKKIADFIIDKIEKNTGNIYYSFDLFDEHSSLKSPWISAMAQGVVISLLSRIYIYTNELKYLNFACEAEKPLKRNINEGGVKKLFCNYYFYEEYPNELPPLTLNGFIYTLIGLYDLSSVNRESKETEQLYYKGIETLKYILPLYDNDELSPYDLFHLFNKNKALLNYKYHNVHIRLLKTINSITPDEKFDYYYKVWECKPQYDYYFKIKG